MPDCLCESCHWPTAIDDDLGAVLCRIKGMVEKPMINAGESAHDVCGDFDNEEDWEHA